jgi:hypothetical protein
VKIDGINYISRSEGVTRQNCRRRRLIENDLDGHGYRLKAGSVPLLGGQGFHSGHALLLGHYSGYKPLDFTPFPDPIAYVLDKVLAEYKSEVLEAGVRSLSDPEVAFTIEEQQTMLEGVMRGWVEYRLPRILEDYSVMEIEQQWLWKLGDGIYLPMRQDAILRRKFDGLLYIMDYKGIPYGDTDSWQLKHESSDQTVLYITALEERTGEPVGGIFYEGLVRGQWKKETAKFSPFSGQKIQMSPYCYGYGNFDGEYPSAENNWANVQGAYTNRKGWGKFRVRDRFTVPEWLEVLKRDAVLPELFISMEPVNPTPEFRQRIRRQRYMNEVRYLTDLEKFNQLREEKGLDHPDTQIHLDLFAEQNNEECPRYGGEYKCPNLPFCTSPGGGLDLFATDEQFVPREPHHDLTGLIPLESLRKKAA